MADLYDLGDRPPLGEVPKRMHAYAVRQERFGPPRDAWKREILPTLTLPRADLERFANSVTERFSNPFIKHYLLSIALNSVSKYKARILGTVLDYQRAEGRLPPRLTFALAALIAFHRGSEIRDGALIGRRDGAEYRIQDDAAVLQAFRDAWRDAGERPSRDACLALVRRLVESMGGQIAVESRLGHGTTFRFTLPVATIEAVNHPVEVG